MNQELVIRKLSAQLSQVRYSRIKILQRRIGKGSYKVPAEMLARSLLLGSNRGTRRIRRQGPPH